jgi:8-oxo-dGTP diphosphatase
MNNKIYKFPVIFWGKEKSTKVQFKISNSMPLDAKSVTSVMCAVYRGEQILLVKPKRGWGLPGGHIEIAESPIDAIKRECAEEASIEIKNIKLVGYWEANKIKEVEENKKYPRRGYQLLYIAEIDKIHEFNGEFEVTDRKFVNPHDISSLHHNFKDFEVILQYLIDLKGDGNA